MGNIAMLITEIVSFIKFGGVTNGISKTYINR